MEVKLKLASQLVRATAGVCLWASSTFVAALGLGHIEHQSWLGEPLRAELEILDPQEQYAPEDLRLRQIYPEEAASLGVDVVATRFPIKIKMRREGGKLMVRLTSSRPVSEPFLNFMLALEWPTGKTYREYSLLLDPKGQGIEPAVISRAPSAGQTTREPRANVRLVNEGQPQRPARAQAAPVLPVSSGSNNAAAGGEYWTVGSGQTLSQIAQKVRIDSNIQLQAVTNHLYRGNPQAFSGGIDKLEVGSRLRLPSKAEYAQMPRWRETPVAAIDEVPRNTARQTDVVASNSNAQVEYQVAPGDTLSQVAQKMRQDPNIPLQEVIDQIYQQNPQAFDGGMHRLRVGADLQLSGHAAEPSRAVSMNTVDVSELVGDVPNAEQFEGQEPNAAPATITGSLRLSDSVVTEDQLLNGELPSTADVPVSRQIQMVSELTDKLNSENRDLRRRIEAIEGSDNITLLQDLVLLQSKQIGYFQEQLTDTLALLEQQKGSGSLDSGLRGLVTDNNTEQNANPASDGAGDNSAEQPATAAAQEPQTQEPQTQEQEAAGPEGQAQQSQQQATETDMPIIEGQGLGNQLADQNAAASNTQESKAAEQAKPSAEPKAAIWPYLLAVVVLLFLAIAALLDWRRPNGILRQRLGLGEPEEQTNIAPQRPMPPSITAAEPVVRVRQREPVVESPFDEDDEDIGLELDAIVQVPLAPIDLPEDDDKAEIEPLITGMAKWNRKDIPMLDVEESEVEDLEQDDESLSFDDFGLMNPISIEDLDIDLGDDLEAGFKLDLDDLDDEDDQQGKA